MFISRTTRDISQIPGVNTFRSLIQQAPQQQQMISIAACSSCKEVFNFPQDTPWTEIERIIEEHRLRCDKKRATASANAKKRWAKERQRRAAAARPQPPQPADINIKQKRRARAEEVKASPPKTCRTLPERKVLLEEDPWTVTETLDPKHVECVACGHRITLDQRRLYYPGMWLKHKERCTGIDQRFTRADMMLRPIIRRRFLMQVNPPHKAFLDPNPYYLPRISLPTRKRRLRFRVNSRFVVRRVRVASTAHTEQRKEKEDKKVDAVSGCAKLNSNSEAEVAQPTKTSPSKWWTTVLGPGTGKCQPVARPDGCSAERAMSASPGPACRAESLVETQSQAYDQLSGEGDDSFQSTMVWRGEARVFGRVSEKECSYQSPSWTSDGGSSSPVDMVHGDAQTIRQYGTYESEVYPGSPLVNISALSRHASPTPCLSSPGSLYEQSPVLSPIGRSPFHFNCTSPISRPESCASLGYVFGELEFGTSP